MYPLISSAAPVFRRSTRQTLLGAAVFTLIGLAGCATAPAGSAPAATTVNVPSQWSESAVAIKGVVAAEWWRDFGSNELDALIDTALKSNRDLKIAAARLAQARALTDGAQAERLPQLGAVAGVQRGRETGIDPRAERSFGGLRASWEVDVFGRGALAVDAAQADAQAATQALRATQIALAADVATAYFELQTLSHRVALNRQAIAVAQRQVEVVRRKFDAGQATSVDVDRWQAELAQEQAVTEQLDGSLRVRHRQLAVLLGVSEAPVLNLQATASTPQPPATLLPGELLERRPDVLRQARALDAALARVGVARREVYPRLQIEWANTRERTAIVGQSASPQVVLGYGVSLTLPILDGGRIRANIAVNEARANEAMAEYEKAMLAALSDAEVALAQWSTSEASLSKWQQAQAAGETAAQRAERLFDAGLTDVSAVLDARRSYLRAQDAVSQAEGARWAAAVGLRRVFAGAV